MLNLELIIFLLFAGSIAVTIGIFWWQRLKRVYCRTWYDLSAEGPNEEMEWCQIRELMEADPLNHNREGREQKWCRISKRHLPYDFAILILVAVGILVVLWASDILYGLGKCSADPCVLYADNTTRLHKIKDLALLAGVPVFVLSIIALSYQIRLRSRSINRQDWINSIRKEIGHLIDYLPPVNASKRSVEKATSDIQSHYSKLELYLNPSERVHRAFLSLIRFMYGFPVTECDRKIRKKLRIEESRFDNMFQDRIHQQEHWNKWRIKVVRLANVLLKREWEQVKHVK